MGYFYSTSVSILDGTLVSKMGHLHMASCDAGRFTPQIWGFSFDPQRERTMISHEDTIYCVKDSSVRCGGQHSRGLIMALRD